MRLQKLLALALVVLAPMAVRAQTITTVAGGGSVCPAPATPCALTVSVGGPSAAVKDASGNFLILDDYQNRILKVDTNGNLTIFAGNGAPGYTGDGGPAANAELNGPRSMFIDGFGNIFIADADNGVIREIAGSTGTQYGISMTAGSIYTVAGNFAKGLGYSGDNGPATSAQMFFPDGVWVDGTGDIFIGDKANHVVREVAAANGTNYGIAMLANNIYTIAGVANSGAKTNGYSGDGGPANKAKLNNPWGVYGDGNGNIFIADSTNNAIREVIAATGNITTVAGTPPTGGFNGTGVLATTAQLNVPLGVYVDGFGNLFISDTSNQIVREVPAATANGMTKGFIYTVAGMPGAPGRTGNGGLATSANLDDPSSVFVDGSGNLFISDTDGHELREVVGPTPAAGQTTGNIYNVAGNSFEFFGGDGGAATNATLANPAGVATDTSGNIYISDTLSNVIRKFAVGGNIQTVAGRPDNDFYNGDAIPATEAAMGAPQGAFVDGSGNIFIADTNDCLIREVVASTSEISTVAGTVPAAGVFVPSCGSTGDTGVATSAKLNAPNSVFVDGSGNIFIADTGNHVIREVAGPKPATGMTTGNIYTVAGTLNSKGDSATQLNGPQGVFVDHFGDIFIADTGNQAIREIPALNGVNYGITMVAGTMYTVAGKLATGGYSGDGGLAINATMLTPFGVLVDDAGNIFISDSGNHIIREVAAATGNISTVAGTIPTAGTPNPGFSGDTGAPTSAKLDTPEGVAAGPNRSLLLADSLNNRIRSIGPNLLSAPEPAILMSPEALTFTTNQLVGTTSATPLTATVTNSGTAALNISGITLTGTESGDFAFFPASANTCGTSLAVNTSCTVSVTFTPTATGARSASISITDNARGVSNSQQTIKLSGNAVQPTATLSATSVTFTPAQIVGTASAAKTVTLTNNGTAPLTFTMNLPGSDFAFAPAAANTCATASPLATGANCTISVEFTPTAATALSANITLTDDAPASPQTISLSGTGLPTPATATLSSTSIGFASQLVTTASATSSVTLSNNGTGALTITQMTITGDFALTPANPCGGSVASGAKCTIGVTFTPTTAGPRTGAVTITDNAGGVAGTQQTINLTGAGLSLSFAAASGGSTTQTVKAGQTATYNLQLSAAGGAPTDVISLAIACTGAPSLATCSGPSTPVTVVPGTPTAFAITVKTTGSNAAAPSPQSEPRMQPPAAIRTLPLLTLVLLSIAAMLAWMQGPVGRRRTLSVTMAACLVLLPMSAAVLLQGCGGGSSGGSTPPPVTAVAPTIGTQPANQTVMAGQTAAFSVVAAGTAPLTYQWQKNGTAISGATSANYTTPATVDSDNGATFAVVVSNSAGNVTSGNATVTVQFTPSATSNLTVTLTPTLNGKAQPAQTTTLTLIVQ
jgi:trimeric autotransporter adhesin